MNYLDTSFIAPYYLNEESSADVHEVLQAATDQLAVSDWTLAEFASLLARLVRMRELELSSADEAMGLFDQDARVSMVVIEPVRADFDLARNLLLREPDLGLRTPDALHLSIAGNRRLVLHALDRTLLKAADTLGISATDAGMI